MVEFWKIIALKDYVNSLQDIYKQIRVRGATALLSVLKLFFKLNHFIHVNQNSCSLRIIHISILRIIFSVFIIIFISSTFGTFTMDVFKHIDYILGHLVGVLTWFFVPLLVFVSSHFRLYLLYFFCDDLALLWLFKVDWNHRYKLVKELIFVCKEADKIWFLESIKHDFTGVDQSFDWFSVKLRFLYFKVPNMWVKFLNRNSFKSLLNLSRYCVVPLNQILLTSTGKYPSPCIIFQLKAILIHAIKLYLLWRWLRQWYPRILERYQVIVLLLLPNDILLVIEELLL